MKTPWRFLSGLVSRKAPEDRAADQVSKTPDILAVEHHPGQEEKNAEEAVALQPDDQAETHPSKPETETIDAGSATEPASEADGVAEEAVSVETPTPAETESVPNDAPGIEAPPVLEANEGEPPEPTARAPKAKKSGQPTLVKPVETPLEEARPAEAIVEKTVDHELLALDQEIAELRRLLSEKLVQQNAYLKSMLERYKVSG